MQRWLIVLVLATLASGAATSLAAAVDPTQEALQAPRVRRYVSVALSADGKALEYTFDDAQIEAPAKADTPLSVVGNGNVAFVVANYNPLTMRLSLADKLFDEPNLAALAKGLTPIVATLDKAAAERSQAALGVAGELPTFNLALRAASAVAKGAGGAAGCERFDAASLIARFNTEIAAARLSKAKLEQWTAAANGRKGIDAVRVQIETELAELAKHLPEATAAHATLLGWFERRTKERADAIARLRQLGDDAKPVLARLAEVEAWLHEADTDARRKALADAIKRHKAEQAELQTRVDVITGAARQHMGELCEADDAFATALLFVRDAPEVEIERVKTLHEQLALLAKTFARLTDAQRWYERRGGREAAFVAGSRQTLEDSGRLVTFKIDNLVPRLRDGLIEFEATDTSASLQLRLRERNMFAFEVVPALVYSFLEEPQYAAVDKDGQKVVARDGTKEREFKGAIMLNAVCRCTGKSSLYPMLQFGITPDDSLVAFFMGGGFRFLRPRGLSMSFGVVVTRSKDLDRLQVGSSVADQATLDRDLKERSVIKPYFSVQFKF